MDIQKLYSGRIFQVFAVLSASLSCISDGMHYGWSSPSIPVLQSNSTPVLIDSSNILWLENAYTLGGCVGLPLTLCTLDIIGRKFLIISISGASMLSWLLIATATSVGVLYIARFIAGMATAINFIAITIYSAEISDKVIRGRLTSFISIQLMLGIIMVYIVGPQLSIAGPSVIAIVILLVQILLFLLFPESPYYLLITKRWNDADQALRKLRSSDDVTVELEEIAENIRIENASRGKPLDLVKVKSNRKVFILLTVLTVTQQFSGIAVIPMNLHVILQNTPISISINVIAMLFVIFLGVSSIIAIFLIDHVGRKRLLSISSIVCALPMFSLSIYYWALSAKFNLTKFEWIPIISLMLYAITFQCGLGVVPSVLVSELYPSNIKALGVSIFSLQFMISCALAIFLYYQLIQTFNFALAFFLFGACCLLTGLFSLMFVPETKGKSLEEIQKTLNSDNSSDPVMYGAL